MPDVSELGSCRLSSNFYGEGLPKVLLEAAACGRPLIASDVPGCREIAIHNETALLVPPRDAAALADAMQTLAGDAQLRRRLGQRAREVVCSNFTIEHVNAQTIQIYRDLLSRMIGVLSQAAYCCRLGMGAAVRVY